MGKQDLISLAEAALRLRMTREQALRRVQRGELAGCRMDGRWYVERSALEARAAAAEPQAKTA